MMQKVIEPGGMACQCCQMDWSTREVAGFSPYQMSQFKDGVGCPHCLYLVQVIVCLNGDDGDNGTWQRVEIAIGRDVHLAYVEAAAEEAAQEMIEALGHTVTAVLAQSIIGVDDC